jgi:hypothetical protein
MLCCVDGASIRELVRSSCVRYKISCMMHFFSLVYLVLEVLPMLGVSGFPSIDVLSDSIWEEYCRKNAYDYVQDT